MTNCETCGHLMVVYITSVPKHCSNPLCKASRFYQKDEDRYKELGKGSSMTEEYGELARLATTGNFPAVQDEGSRKVLRELDHYTPHPSVDSSELINFQPELPPKTLRDEFAMVLLPIVCNEATPNETTWEMLFKKSYQAADAMIEARRQ